jgi:hypothetical protein
MPDRGGTLAQFLTLPIYYRILPHRPCGFSVPGRSIEKHEKKTKPYFLRMDAVSIYLADISVAVQALDLATCG